MPIAQALAVLPGGQVSTTPLTSDEVGRYLADTYGTEAERCRRERHARRNNLYRDGGSDYMRSVIDRVFQDPEVRRLRKEWVDHARFSNSLKRIVNEVSTVYAEPAARLVGGSEENRVAFAQLVEEMKLDEVMDYANRMLNLHRAILLGPRVRDEGDGKRCVVVDVITPDQVIAVCDPNDPSRVIAWAIQVEYRSARRPDGWRPPAWQLWNDHESWLLDKDLRPIGEPVPHGLGVCPLLPINYHAETIAGFWPGEEGEDLVAAQVAIWMANILLLKETKSATKQTTISGDVTTAARNQSMDTEVPSHFPEGVTASTVDMSMDTSLFTAAGDHALARVGNNYGLSMGALTHQGVQSAEARELMLEPLRHLRRRQIKTFRRVEKSLAQLIAVIARVDAPTLAFDAAGFRINFGEPQVLQTEAERLATFKERQALGVDNVIDFMRRQDPDLDEADAIASLRRNFWISTMRVVLMKDLMAISGQLGAAAVRADTNAGDVANGSPPSESTAEGEPVETEDMSWVEEVVNAA